jgi:hypothetical protein
METFNMIQGLIKPVCWKDFVECFQNVVKTAVFYDVNKTSTAKLIDWRIKNNEPDGNRHWHNRHQSNSL